MSRYYTKSQEWGDFDASLKAVADNPCLLNAEYAGNYYPLMT